MISESKRRQSSILFGGKKGPSVVAEDVTVASPRIQRSTLEEKKRIGVLKKNKRRKSIALFGKRRASISQSDVPENRGETRTNEAQRETKNRKDIEQILDSYANVVHLCTKNKIDTKNTWKLDILDHIDDIIHSQKDSFQKLGCALQTSVQVYEKRVDSLHLEGYRVLKDVDMRGTSKRSGNSTGVGSADEGDETGSELDSGTDDSEREADGTRQHERKGSSKKKKRRSRKKRLDPHRTVEELDDNITVDLAQLVDMTSGDAVIDPFFTFSSTASIRNENSLKSAMLSMITTSEMEQLYFNRPAANQCHQSNSVLASKKTYTAENITDSIEAAGSSASDCDGDVQEVFDQFLGDLSKVDFSICDAVLSLQEKIDDVENLLGTGDRLEQAEATPTILDTILAKTLGKRSRIQRSGLPTLDFSRALLPADLPENEIEDDGDTESIGSFTGSPFETGLEDQLVDTSSLEACAFAQPTFDELREQEIQAEAERNFEFMKGQLLEAPAMEAEPEDHSVPEHWKFRKKKKRSTKKVKARKPRTSKPKPKPKKQQQRLVPVRRSKRLNRKVTFNAIPEVKEFHKENPPSDDKTIVQEAAMQLPDVEDFDDGAAKKRH